MFSFGDNNDNIRTTIRQARKKKGKGKYRKHNQQTGRKERKWGALLQTQMQNWIKYSTGSFIKSLKMCGWSW